MAIEKNITMRQYNGTDYDTLYPQTIASQISGEIPISKGGTGATNAESARRNLGVVPIYGGMMTGNLYAFDDSDPSNPKVRNSLLTDTELNDSILVQMPEGCIAWLYE